jgi:hypothetical protein
VTVTDLANALEVAVRRDEDSISAGDRLEYECGDGRRALQLDRLLEDVERNLGRVGPPLDAVIRVEDVNDAARVLVERYRARIFGLPVRVRAILMAFSLASLPARVKKTLSMSPGSSSASLRPRRARGSVAIAGLM